MDYYQGVVVDYLRATRTRFVNTECMIQLDPGDVPKKGRHWICDAVVVDFATALPQVFLCEISYSQTLAALIKRLNDWRIHWAGICLALTRDCGVAKEWPVQPWIFVPEERAKLLEQKKVCVERIGGGMPAVKVAYLQRIAPWTYREWNGKPFAAAEKAEQRTE